MMNRSAAALRDRRRKDLSGDYTAEAVFLGNVRRLKIIVASALLVMWMPATSFCLAENAGVITKNGGCADCPSSQASPCCVLASAAYKLDDNGSAVVPGLGHKIPLVRDTFDAHPEVGASLARKGFEPPPELRSSWQFCIRAAANPRAPSFAS
jgi:hypothetical protein